MTDWQPIVTAPREPLILASSSEFGTDEHGPIILMTDGKLFAAGYLLVKTEGPMMYRGYVNGEITNAFADRIKNPDEGKKSELWITIGCSAFDRNSSVQNYDGTLHFDPTLWQPLLSP